MYQNVLTNCIDILTLQNVMTFCHYKIMKRDGSEELKKNDNLVILIDYL
jgi:hypothetical protein